MTTGVQQPYEPDTPYSWAMTIWIVIVGLITVVPAIAIWLAPDYLLPHIECNLLTLMGIAALMIILVVAALGGFIGFRKDASELASTVGMAIFILATASALPASVLIFRLIAVLQCM